MAKRPRIGITMRLEPETRRFYLGRDYSEAVEACGGVPVHLSLIPKSEYIVECLADLDGVLLPGSNTDVDPHYYDEEPHHRLGTVIPEKDETDRLVLLEVERLNLPLLAICYGMQALNVVRGGTLVQDIESQVPKSIKHEQGMPVNRNSHSLKIANDSILAELNAVKTSKEVIRVNSSHHQAIKRIGKNLRAVAWAKDGIIECVQDTRKSRFALGVQWHPEMTADIDRISRDIFELFVEKCSYSRKNTVTNIAVIRNN
ncbi:MAG: gamma-glutamyl-gamma-aminobutyrate hydrolase family protein [Chloracidobacterium sp.]|nr:gamma-glutamyl-gamma-aminobutyrate hydrolase family protein [Chloracidobacterium sp.]